MLAQYARGLSVCGLGAIRGKTDEIRPLQWPREESNPQLLLNLHSVRVAACEAARATGLGHRLFPKMQLLRHYSTERMSCARYRYSLRPQEAPQLQSALPRMALRHKKVISRIDGRRDTHTEGDQSSDVENGTQHSKQASQRPKRP